MKKFLAGSAIAEMYKTESNGELGDLISISTTQIDNSINLSVESQEVRSGYGNALDFIYYYGSRFEGQLNDAQFNIDYIEQNTGAERSHSANIYEKINATLKNGESEISVAGSAQPASTNVKVWVYYDEKPYTFAGTYNNVTNKITFTNDQIEIPAGKTELTVCARYMGVRSGTNVTSLKINSNIIPNVVTLVLTAQLYSSNSGVENSSRIGTVQFVIPRAQLTGAQEISLSSSGVAQTPLSYLALKIDEETIGCSSNGGAYGYITQILEGVEWYEGIKSLAISAEDDELTVANGTAIDTYALTGNDAFLVRPRTNLHYSYKLKSGGAFVDVGASDTYFSIDGVVKQATGLGGAILKVAVYDNTGKEVTSIDSDTATLKVIGE